MFIEVDKKWNFGVYRDDENKVERNYRNVYHGQQHP